MSEIKKKKEKTNYFEYIKAKARVIDSGRYPGIASRSGDPPLWRSGSQPSLRQRTLFEVQRIVGAECFLARADFISFKSENPDLPLIKKNTEHRTQNRVIGLFLTRFRLTFFQVFFSSSFLSSFFSLLSFLLLFSSFLSSSFFLCLFFFKVFLLFYLGYFCHQV